MSLLMERMQIIIPVDMTVKEYLNIDDHGNAPTFELPEDLIDLLIHEHYGSNEGADGFEEVSAGKDLVSCKNVQDALKTVMLYLTQQEVDTSVGTKKMLFVCNLVKNGI
ncbi:hypothetical protein R1flu_015703 [Riccia fluitans]|uniref:Uncharacterized protein n=1 Tax=Riccia fluitans TaxID=41844 RepID=A0ABD1YMS9_9MARC